MTQPHLPQTPEVWFRHLFSAQAALDGSVVRRKSRDMERMVGRDAFVAEIHRRGFTAIENAGQVIVFCNSEPVALLAGTQTFAESLPANPRRGFVSRLSAKVWQAVLYRPVARR